MLHGHLINLLLASSYMGRTSKLTKSNEYKLPFRQQTKICKWIKAKIIRELFNLLQTVKRNLYNQHILLQYATNDQS